MRYRANASFNAWKRGDEFESLDPHHEIMADAGLLSRLDEVPDSLTGVVQPQVFIPADMLSAEERNDKES